MTTLDEIAALRVHFDDLAIGQRFVSPRRTVTEADIVEAEVTGLEPGAKPDRGAVTMRRSAMHQDGEAVMTSDWSLVVARSAAAQVLDATS